MGCSKNADGLLTITLVNYRITYTPKDGRGWKPRQRSWGWVSMMGEVGNLASGMPANVWVLLFQNEHPLDLLEGGCCQLVEIDTTRNAFPEGIASIPIRRTPLTIIETCGLETE